MAGNTARWRGPATPPVLAVLVMLAAAPLPAADDPHQWLQRVSSAVDELNYEGTLLHLHGGDSVVIDVAHRVERGRVIERIKARDGDREILRTDTEVKCIFPGQRMVMIEERQVGGSADSPLRGHLPRSGAIDRALYHVAFNGSERIAGRETRVIAIRPKDSFRYGYRIAVDNASGMPLRTQLVDEAGEVLEQVLFTEIKLPARVADSAVRASVDISAFTTRRAAVAPKPAAGVPVPGNWMARDLPPGFRVVAQHARAAAADDRGLQHVVYSDGLATVSVFIEPAVAASEQAEGLSQIGAAYAYTSVIDGMMVTAVGQVPARTAELLARSARPEHGRP